MKKLLIAAILVGLASLALHPSTAGQMATSLGQKIEAGTAQIVPSP